MYRAIHRIKIYAVDRIIHPLTSFKRPCLAALELTNKLSTGSKNHSQNAKGLEPILTFSDFPRAVLKIGENIKAVKGLNQDLLEGVILQTVL